MNAYDYAVLFAVILGIALYGILRTRGKKNLHDYLKGKRHHWLAIGLSVMATQASAVTFLSTPGQGYTSGMSFVQNYFAVPLAMVIIAAFFLPIYRRLNVYTAYEFLSTRFDKKTRLFAAGIFLIQRALNAGYTVYAPAIVLSTVFGWSLSWTIILSSAVCITYTVVGGSDAVTHTQKYQFAIIMGGMVAAFCILMSKIPCSFTDALTLAGHFGKTNAVSFSVNPHERYTVWTGFLGGIFLMLSYFGTDQSQVQRYISGDNLRESRLGLMFNALLKIPMQFGILLLGVMIFVFYLFNQSPLFFNKAELQKHLGSQKFITDFHPPGGITGVPGSEHENVLLERTQEDAVASQGILQKSIQDWLAASRDGNRQAASEALRDATFAQFGESDAHSRAKDLLKQADPRLSTNDSDYVFITFILDNLPHGLIGLLVACFFAATLNAKSAELNSLTTCTVIDFYRYLIRPPRNGGTAGGIVAERGIGVPPMSPAEGPAEPQPSSPGAGQTPLPQHGATGDEPVDSSVPSAPAHRRDADATRADATDRHYVRASRLITIAWGIVATLFALFLFTYFQENLIQATNIVGSVFYGVILGLFLIAFFIKFIKGTAAFWGAVLAEILVLAWFTLGHFIPALEIAYLWYNLVGSLGCIAIATILQLILGNPTEPRGFPVIATSPAWQRPAD